VPVYGDFNNYLTGKTVWWFLFSHGFYAADAMLGAVFFWTGSTGLTGIFIFLYTIIFPGLIDSAGG